MCAARLSHTCWLGCCALQPFYWLTLHASAHPRCRQASRILAYLGDHLMLLTSMNLRDYLLLKVGA